MKVVEAVIYIENSTYTLADRECYSRDYKLAL